VAPKEPDRITRTATGNFETRARWPSWILSITCFELVRGGEPSCEGHISVDVSDFQLASSFSRWRERADHVVRAPPHRSTAAVGRTRRTRARDVVITLRVLVDI